MAKEKKTNKVKKYHDPISIEQATFVKNETWKDSNGLEQCRPIYMFQIDGKWKQGPGTLVTLPDGTQFLCTDSWEDVE